MKYFLVTNFIKITSLRQYAVIDKDALDASDHSPVYDSLLWYFARYRNFPFSKISVLYAKLVDIVQEWWYVEQRTTRNGKQVNMTDPFEVRLTVNKNKEAS